MLSLTNFRNYTSLVLQCDAKANLFLGENGQGKTNLLEAIYYLCVARSCREALDRELILFGGDHFLIKGDGRSAIESDLELEIRYGRQAGKNVRINQQPQRNLSDLYGSLAAVVVSPDDRQLVQGSPSGRRRFLDIAISQSNSSYLSVLQDYRRVVRQRNEALRAYHGHADNPPELDVWNEQLVRFGSRIMRRRLQAVHQLNTEAKKLHQTISDNHEELDVVYAPSFAFEDPEIIEDCFKEELKRAAREERARGVTVVGPHRDDLTLTMDGSSLQAYGSQGQQKTAATAMKLAEAQFLWQQLGSAPILLLDDIFAELDATRTGKLIELLPTYGQVFITAAKASDLGTYGHQFRRFKVCAGTVTTLPQ